MIDNPNDTRHVLTTSEKQVFGAFRVDCSLELDNSSFSPDADVFGIGHVTYVQAMLDVSFQPRIHLLEFPLLGHQATSTSLRIRMDGSKFRKSRSWATCLRKKFPT
jgi:hypothetical protein